MAATVEEEQAIQQMKEDAANHYSLAYSEFSCLVKGQGDIDEGASTSLTKELGDDFFNHNGFSRTNLSSRLWADKDSKGMELLPETHESSRALRYAQRQLPDRAFLDVLRSAFADTILQYLDGYSFRARMKHQYY